MYKILEPNEKRKGWIIQIEESIFAIGNISDNEIAELAGDKFANIIKCKNFEIENWNVDD